jgi:2-aminomuconate deaminase
MVSSSRVISDKASPRGKYPHVRRAGDFLYLSALSSRRPDGSFEGAIVAASGTIQLDIREQTAAVIRNIADVLSSEGGTLRNLVEISTFLISMRDFEGYNEVYGSFFDYDGPTRTTVAVSELPHPSILIEMKAIAYLPLNLAV